jgi:hypothetical protein
MAPSPRSADVGGRGVLEEFFLDGVPVEAGDGAQSPGDGGAGSAVGLHVPGEAFYVSAADGEQGQRVSAAPGGELAQVEGVGVAGQAAVSGQESGEREPLGVGEHWLDGDEGVGEGRGGHRGHRLQQPGPAGLGRRRSQR